MVWTRKHAIAALGFYVLALAVRSYGIMAPAPQTDEITWRDRSKKIVAVAKRKDFAHLTSHLGHPGAAPALTMALGQVAGGRFNNLFKLNPGDAWYVDDLSSARIANSVFSSLIAPVVYLVAGGVLGVEAAVLSAMLAATDVHQIAYARIAHLDASLAVWVFCCLAAYFQAVQHASIRWKIIAGVLWGFSVSAKASAIALIFVFIVFKFLRLLIHPRCDDSGERSLVSWSDIWALIAGNAVLALTFTKLWPHKSDYLLRLGVVSSFADHVYRSGTFLQQHYLFALGLIVSTLLVSCAVRIVRRGTREECWKKTVLSHLSQAAALSAVLSAALLLVPAVLETLVRFWLRVAGFRTLDHKAHGQVWAPPEFGYIGIILSRPSSLLLLAFFAGVCWIGFSLLRVRREKKDRDVLSFILLMMTVIVVWPAVLSTSAKQAFRYVLPILAPLTIVAVWGLVSIGHGLSTRLRRGCLFLDVRPGSGKAAVLICMIAYQACLLWQIYPDYALYFNSLSGGLKGDIARGGHPWFAGFNEAVSFLHHAAADSGVRKDIATIADKNTVETAYRRQFVHDAKLLNFYFAPTPESADFIFYVPAMAKMTGHKCCREEGALRRVFSYEVDDVPLTEIYQIMPQFFEEPYFRAVLNSPRETGNLVWARNVLLDEPQEESNRKKLLAVFPKRDKAKYVFFYERVHLTGGVTEWRLFAALPKDFDPGSLPSETDVLVWEVGKKCTKTIKLQELEPGRLRPAYLSCSFSEDSSPEVRASWLGRVPVLLSGFDVRHAGQP